MAGHNISVTPRDEPADFGPADLAARARFRWAGAATAAVVAGFVLWLATDFGGSRATTAVDDLGEMVAAFLAGFLCLRRAGRSRHHLDWGWRLLGGSALCWGLGEAVWSYYELAAGREVPFPSLADVFYLLAVPFALAGVLAFFSAPAGWNSRLRVVVDGLIVGLAVLYVSWVSVLGPFFHASSGSTLAQAVGLAYPIGDVIIVSAVILVSGRSRTEDGLPLAWISTALIAMAIADSAFAYLTLHGSYSSGNLLDTGWLASYLVLSLAALRPTPSGPRRAGRQELTWLPYVPVLAVLALVLIRTGFGQPPDGFDVVDCGSLFGLVVLRQVLTLRENEALNASLEAMVKARTALLHRSDERFRSLIQTVSDVITVVEPDGMVSFVSPSVTDVLGYAPHEVHGRSFLDFIHPDDTPTVMGFLAGASEVSRRLDVRMLHCQGDWRYVEAVGSDSARAAALGGFVFAIRDMTERQELEDQLTHQAFHDPLTGLANRALLNDRIGHALARIGRTGRELGVLLVDLDDFKSVNDAWGHTSGDALLLEVSRRLEACLRPEDTVARLGGDEFAVLMEDADGDIAIEVAERLQEALGAPFVLGEAEVRISASIGISHSSSETTSGADVIRNADVAMYQSKGAGKARYEVFRPEMHEAVLRRMALRGELHTAVEESQFLLHYQPLVSLADRAILGFEALVRWDHPNRGMVSPLEFIPIAEESGLIIPLGRWVLQEAVRQLGRWDGLPRVGPPLTMSINLSARQLQSPDLILTVSETITAAGIDPGRITLELTESILLDDVPATVARLHELKALGVKLAIDDFGTGFSSLSYLRRFPLDTLKVDKCFVDDILTDRGEELIRTLLELGDHLGLNTVAEGIELAEQADRLDATGCDIGQGYLFSRPLAAAAAETLLRDEHAATV